MAFGSHCYYLSHMEATVDDAMDFCKQNGSYLIEINSPLENTWIKDSYLLPVNGVTDTCPKFYSCSVWIGARYLSSSGKFVWNQTGEEMVYPEWDVNQPNNRKGQQDCVVLMRKGKANDRGCRDKFQFICEKAAKVLPFLPPEGEG
ncbi:pulmonary surfactant-associated protein D-like [Saccostrea cucullata]|uniref:pulmonary surfactant-associated protein D-like n=1 Tax=Saccostrea cuccullata TaxID=36930 RepID=UPI002ED59B77